MTCYVKISIIKASQQQAFNLTNVQSSVSLPENFESERQKQREILRMTLSTSRLTITTDVATCNTSLCCLLCFICTAASFCWQMTKSTKQHRTELNGYEYDIVPTGIPNIEHKN